MALLWWVLCMVAVALHASSELVHPSDDNEDRPDPSTMLQAPVSLYVQEAEVVEILREVSCTQGILFLLFL